MIKTLSPYYLTIPFVSPASGLTCSKYTLSIWIWNGLKADVPTNPTYQVTKKNPIESILNDKINISRLINSQIEFFKVDITATQLENGSNQVWVKTSVSYTTTNPSDALPQLQNIDLAVKGYSYGMDGENASTPANKILLNGTEFKVSRNSVFNLPIQIEETVVPVATLTITLIAETTAPLYNITYTTTGDLGDIFYRYRLVPATWWTIGFGILTSSPYEVELPIVGGDYEVQLFSFDNANNVNVFSNIYTITIT